MEPGRRAAWRVRWGRAIASLVERRVPLRSGLLLLLVQASMPAGALVAEVLEGHTLSGQAIPCVAQEDGIRLCTGDMGAAGAADLRFSSFDGTALMVYLTLPPAPATGADGPYPLIVQSHGWGAPPPGPDDTQYGGPSARQFALDGYMVVQFAARGWGNSCGSPQSRLINPAACMNGYVHMDDYRFEARDVQHIAGLLTDAGLVQEGRVGVMGESYGGGVSLALATLKDRVMNADGSLSPWLSPNGIPMKIAAATPFAGWSDLVHSLMPNGRSLDFETTSHTANLSPPGVLKLSILSGLYLVGTLGAYYAPPGVDPEVDQNRWYLTLTGGEPYETPLTQEIIDSAARYRSPYYLLAGAFGYESVQPAPLFMANGFTDDIFPVNEVLRYYRLATELYPQLPISLFFADMGHQRGNNKPIDVNAPEMAARIKAFFDHYVKGDAPRPPLNVTAYTQTCPSDVPSGGPYVAPTWEALSAGEVVHTDAGTQTILSVGGDLTVAQSFDPVAGGLACTTAPAAEEQGVASFNLPSPVAGGYTLMGSPTVRADLNVSGVHAYIAARLVDVDPETNTKVLIARGLYRIDPDQPNGRQTFQLYANGWHFAPGHIPRLELLGQDPPFSRPANGVFSIEVSNLELRLPVLEALGNVPAPTEEDGLAAPSPDTRGGATGWLSLLALLSLGSRGTRRAVWVLGLGALMACSEEGQRPLATEPPAEPGLAAAALDGQDDDWPAVPTWGSGTAGYAAASWSYEDYVYDSSAGASGNSGDLAVLQIALGAAAVRYVAKLNSYVVEDPTLIALALDTDCDENTGGGEWPNGSGLSSQGWELLLQVGDAGGSVWFAEGAAVPIPVAVDHQTNLIEFDVPFTIADPREGGQGGYAKWCYTGAVGLGAQSWSESTNVLFRNRSFDQGSEETDENDSADTFQTDKQSAALQSGDLSAFRRQVDFELIASAASRLPEPPPGNLWLTRIYDTPDFPNALPEGAHQGENSIMSPLFNGRFQPYTIYVPQSYRDDPRPAPMLPLLHGITANHRNGWPIEDGAFWTDVVQAQRVIVPMPLGRGEESWYDHVGEVDVLAVIADVKKHFHIDSSKQFLGGASMGGLGALKIAQLHPELFAGLILSVPPMSDRLQGYAIPENNEFDLVQMAESLRHVPVLNFFGSLDPIVPPDLNSERFCARMNDLGYAYECWLDITGSHYSFYNPRFAQIGALLSENSLVIDPAQVSYAVHPHFRRQALDAAVDHLLPYDSAYWVQSIEYAEVTPSADCPLQLPNNANPCIFPLDPNLLDRLVNGDPISRINVRSFGLGEGEPEPTAVPDDPSPILVRTGLALLPGKSEQARNAFELHAEYVRGFDLDLARMGLSLQEELEATVSGNGDLRLGLLGQNVSNCTATLDGASLHLLHQDQRIELALPLAQTPQKLRMYC